MYLTVLAVRNGLHLPMTVIVSLLGLVILMMFGVEALVSLIDAWHNRNGGGG